MFQHHSSVVGRPAAEARGLQTLPRPLGRSLRRFHRPSSRPPFLLWAPALEVKAAESLKTQHPPAAVWWDCLGTPQRLMFCFPPTLSLARTAGSRIYFSRMKYPHTELFFLRHLLLPLKKYLAWQSCLAPRSQSDLHLRQWHILKSAFLSSRDKHPSHYCKEETDAWWEIVKSSLCCLWESTPWTFTPELLLKWTHSCHSKVISNTWGMLCDLKSPLTRWL